MTPDLPPADLTRSEERLLLALECEPGLPVEGERYLNAAEALVRRGLATWVDDGRGPRRLARPP